MEPWGTPALTRMLLQILSICNHTKSSITEKRQNKTKYSTGNTNTFEFVREVKMPHLVESFE